jgi:hypothetical protein
MAGLRSTWLNKQRTVMNQKLVGVLLLLIAAGLFIFFYAHWRPSDIETKGDGILIYGLNINDVVSLAGGIVSLIAGIVTLRRKGSD